MWLNRPSWPELPYHSVFTLIIEKFGSLRTFPRQDSPGRWGSVGKDPSTGAGRYAPASGKWWSFLCGRVAHILSYPWHGEKWSLKGSLARRYFKTRPIKKPWDGNPRAFLKPNNG